MHRDQPRRTVSTARPARKEWEPAREQQHQMEAREHARQSGKAARTGEVRPAEAERQIRQMGARPR